MTSLDRDEDYEALVSLVYEAALEPEHWQAFADALSSALSGDVVTVWLQMPGLVGHPRRWSSFRGKIDLEVFFRYWSDPDSFPWPTETRPEVLEHFALPDLVEPSRPLEQTDYFRDWMAPQGMAPTPPAVHVFGSRGGRAVASLVVARPAADPFFAPDDLAFIDRLVPHLQRGYRIHDRLTGLARQEDVLQEVIDRLPTGVMLLDDHGRVVAVNACAQASIDKGLGLRVEDGRPVIDDPDDDEWLGELIGKAVDPGRRSDLRDGTGVTQASREGHLPVLVTPLLAPPRESESPEAAAVIFLGDPRLAEIATDNVLRTLYELTHAEADLTRLLADGHSLEEAAERRGVKPNTARSQLKRIFAKTGAKRQSDLVRIVLNATAALRGH